MVSSSSFGKPKPFRYSSQLKSTSTRPTSKITCLIFPAFFSDLLLSRALYTSHIAYAIKAAKKAPIREAIKVPMEKFPVSAKYIGRQKITRRNTAPASASPRFHFFISIMHILSFFPKHSRLCTEPGRAIFSNRKIIAEYMLSRCI